MHDYLRAIGFSQIKQNKEVRELLKAIMMNPTAEFVASDRDSYFGEKVKEFAQRIGIAIDHIHQNNYPYPDAFQWKHRLLNSPVSL